LAISVLISVRELLEEEAIAYTPAGRIQGRKDACPRELLAPYQYVVGQDRAKRVYEAWAV